MTPDQARDLILSGKAPPDMVVEGSLDLGWSTLKAIPSNLKVGGWLWLKGCNSLQSLPENLRVGGWLDIEGCTSLKLPYGIPEGVKGKVFVNEEVLRNNKEYLLTMVNVRFENMEMYKRILAEG